MRRLQTVLVITTIIFSLLTRIRSSQDESEEIGTDQFEGAFGAGMNCPPGVGEALQNCKQEAKKFWNVLTLEQSTGPQICGYRDHAIQCTQAFNFCKSQKAQVVKSVIEEIFKLETGSYYDCERLQEKYVPLSAGRECKDFLKCIHGTSQGVSSTVDYTDRNTFAQHCRNKNVMIECFNNLDDICNVPVPQNKKAALVKAAREAYVRFYCDDIEKSNFGSGSNAGWGTTSRSRSNFRSGSNVRWETTSRSRSNFRSGSNVRWETTSRSRSNGRLETTSRSRSNYESGSNYFLGLNFGQGSNTGWGTTSRSRSNYQSGLNSWSQLNFRHGSKTGWGTTSRSRSNYQSGSNSWSGLNFGQGSNTGLGTTSRSRSYFGTESNAGLGLNSESSSNAGSGSNFGSGSNTWWGQNYSSGSTPLNISSTSKGAKTKSDWTTFTILGAVTLLLIS